MGHQILIQHIIKFSFLLEKSIMDGVYVIFILVEHHLSFFFYFYILEELYFMVYVLPFGQMSFWGATVITNLLSPFPSLVEWLCGGYCVYSPQSHSTKDGKGDNKLVITVAPPPL